MSLSVIIFFHFRRIESEQAKTRLEQLAATQATALNHAIDEYTDFLRGFSLLFSLPREINAADFTAAAQAARVEFSGLDAVEWAPLIEADALPALSARLEAQGRPPLQVQRRVANNQLASVEVPDQWIQPVIYVEPVAPNAKAYGFDVLSGINRSEIELARETGTSVMSHITLLLRDEDVAGFALYQPVYHGPENQRAYRGVVIGIFVLHDFVADIARHIVTDTADLLLVDRTARGNNGVIALVKSDGSTQTSELPQLDSFFSPPICQVHIPVWERDWELMVRPSPAWIAANTPVYPWWVLGLSVAFTIGVTLVIIQRDQHLATIEQRVEQRTEELHASETKLRAILEHSSNLIFIRGLDGRYSMVNSAFLKMTALTEAQIIGQTDEVYLSSEDVERYTRMDQEVIRSGQGISFENIQQIDGRDITFWIEKFPLRHSDGRIFAVGVIATDLTKFKNLEQEKAATQRRALESQRFESMSVLAGGIAHEFNNILTAILGNAGLLRMEFNNSEDTRSYLAQIEHSSKRAAELCNQMMTFSGRGEFELEAINLNDVVTKTVTLLRPQTAHTATTKLELGPALPPIEADLSQISQVIVGLLTNAYEALVDTGTITVTTRLVTLNASRIRQAVASPRIADGEFIELVISDTGCGIEASVLHRIWEPFYSTKFDGRGLGLAAALGVVNGHGGPVFAESTPGIGTSVTVCFPVSVRPFAPHFLSTPPFDQTGRSGHRILVVDDEFTIREITRGILTHRGYVVEVAEDGQKGLEAFTHREVKFDLVLLDMAMPVMEGHELLPKLRHVDPAIAVLAMSGYSEREVRNRFGKHPISGFLQKPFTMEKLAAAVADALDGIEPSR
ncbi:CHASE domain-containing protein [Synoicihabitans lomoniglobus]|uniref:histidine kinase n=1 Tax=Synoicihabitans lomoniglobus TaxID=2909285 RepID=A0AAF0I698_9BACT|nr:CHASE domain-containing protein [Opitutaceae bacterium LMO-M01]WED67440.1 CHASE domain-containing protein [Opitutaceae bacterium LMO-M01]